MPHNLTEVDAFTANVAVPDGGDVRSAASVETPFQALTNRSLNAKNRIAALEAIQRGFASFSITGALASGALCTLAEVHDPNNLYSVAANAITLPAVGYYQIAIRATVTSSNATNPTFVGLGVEENITNIFSAQGWRFSATVAQEIQFAGSTIHQCTSVANTIGVRNSPISVGTTTIVAGARLLIMRLQ